MNDLELAVNQLENQARNPEALEREKLDDMIRRMKVVEARLNAIEKRLENYDQARESRGV